MDADVIARQLVEPGSAALGEIKSLFGPWIIRADGSLDRAELRSLVFEDPDKRHQLEQILHPKIRLVMEQWLESLSAPYAILVIPLLLETGQTTLADRVLVVDCPESLQIARVKQRDGLSEAQIKQMLAAQVDRKSRLAAADDVIENSGNLAELTAAAKRLHLAYLELAKTNT